jgi:hypothetical protein
MDSSDEEDMSEHSHRNVTNKDGIHTDDTDRDGSTSRTSSSSRTSTTTVDMELHPLSMAHLFVAADSPMSDTPQQCVPGAFHSLEQQVVLYEHLSREPNTQRPSDTREPNTQQRDTLKRRLDDGAEEMVLPSTASPATTSLVTIPDTPTTPGTTPGTTPDMPMHPALASWDALHSHLVSHAGLQSIVVHMIPAAMALRVRTPVSQPECSSDWRAIEQHVQKEGFDSLFPQHIRHMASSMFHQYDQGMVLYQKQQAAKKQLSVEQFHADIKALRRFPNHVRLNGQLVHLLELHPHLRHVHVRFLVPTNASVETLVLKYENRGRQWINGHCKMPKPFAVPLTWISSSARRTINMVELRKRQEVLMLVMCANRKQSLGQVGPDVLRHIVSFLFSYIQSS